MRKLLVISLLFLASCSPSVGDNINRDTRGPDGFRLVKRTQLGDGNYFIFYWQRLGGGCLLTTGGGNSWTNDLAVAPDNWCSN